MSSAYKHDVIESTWRKLYITQAARKAVTSSFKLSCAFILLFIDLSYSSISGLFSLAHPMIWFIEFFVALLLILQLLTNGLVLLRYLWATVFGSVVSITEEQRRLMAIPANDTSFRTPQKSRGDTSKVASTPMTFHSTPSFGDSSMYKTNFTTPSPHHSSYHSSPGLSASLGLSPYNSFIDSSLHSSYNASFNSSLDKSLNVSGISHSSGKRDFDRSSLRSRRSASLPITSKSSKYSRITNVETLQQYLREEEEKELNRSQASPDNLTSGNVSFWSYGANPMDFVHILRRFAYQLAPRSAAAPTLSSSTDQFCSQGIGEAWAKYGVTEDDLYQWTEKLRKWLSFTIITPLNKEIANVNKTLQKIGCEDTQIGEVGVSTLKQLALTKGSYVPTLNSIVPYLDFTANQEYLLNRIKDLSTGSMSAFTWNKGGTYGKTWSEHLPTDASLVMHLFCCYLDARLPAQPKYPDGKTFTSQYFVKSPDKPNFDRKENLQIYQSTVNPPLFQVVIGSQAYSLAKGRNNMFQAILLFLYHIKVKESGMLGRVNLGMSGLNMLWVFD